MITSIITFLGSSFFSSVFQLISQWKRDKQQLELAKLSLQGSAITAQVSEMQGARATDSDSIIKRLLSIIIVFIVFVVPTLVMLFKPDMTITMAYFNFIGSDKSILEYISSNGYIIFPYQTMIAEMVLGYYFGRSLVRR